MNNKGFTLIELLAVIVILAIIALIATPIIIGIINDTRNSASDESAKLVISNVELAYSTAYMKNGGVEPTIEDIYSSFKMDNATMDESGNIETTLGVTCETKTDSNKLVVTCKGKGKTKEGVSTKTDMPISTESTP